MEIVPGYSCMSSQYDVTSFGPIIYKYNEAVSVYSELSQTIVRVMKVLYEFWLEGVSNHDGSVTEFRTRYTHMTMTDVRCIISGDIVFVQQPASPSLSCPFANVNSTLLRH